MATVARSIRASEWIWEVVDREAVASGVSTAAFVRASMLSAAIIAARRRGAGDVAEFERLVTHVLGDG